MTRRGAKEVHGAETGVIRKDWRGRIRVALIYPNRYEAGMANLGFHQIYRIFNESDAYVCERAFLPDPGSPPVSLESRRPLPDFDILAFSISFENDYLNLVHILEGARIPLRAADRGPKSPLVMAGGVACMLNPEPVAPFIDCFLIGEAEEILPAFMEFFAETDRRDLLSVLSRDLPGVYVPSLYSVSYNEDGTLAAMAPAPGAPDRVPRVYVPDLSKAPTCSTVLTSGAAFSDGYLVEVSRGCPHGCRFCGAGFVYRPPRFRPPELLRACLADGAGVSSHVGLVGAAVSDLPDLEGLCRTAGDVRLSFSSLRADRLTESLVSALRSGGVKTATVAPEAGSQRMRDIINKGISERDILSAARNLVAGGIPNLKLYFMVGFPGETDQDIEEIILLCRKMKEVFLEESRILKRIGAITVSLNAFVPKPATPFQWAGMDESAVLKQKIRRIREGLKGVPNLTVHADNPKQAYIQAFLSRGDRRAGEALTHPDRGNWPKVLRDLSFDPDFFVTRLRLEDEIFPWDIIDHGVRKEYLREEYLRALSGKTTPPCPETGGCRRCGACF